MALEPGTVIDRRYLVGDRIGRGGMGEVYAAVQRGVGGFERKVAIKIVRPESSEDGAAAGGESLERLLAEARLLALLHHPGIVSVLDVGQDGALVYVVMELLEGLDLARVMRSSAPPLAVALEVLTRAADGLAYAHELLDERGAPLGIVHRDVSPHNIFIADTGVVKLLDFGIARSTAQTGAKTATGLVRGKPGYMSPEQAVGDPVDARTDVFALGIVAWEMLAGARLFDAANDLKTLHLVQHARVPPLPPELPSELVAIIGRTLERDPHARTASARSLALELEAVVVRQGLPSGPGIVADHLVDARAAIERDQMREQQRIALDALPPVGEATMSAAEQRASQPVAPAAANRSAAATALERPMTPEVVTRNARTPTRRPREDARTAQLIAAFAPRWRVAALAGGLGIVAVVVVVAVMSAPVTAPVVVDAVVDPRPSAPLSPLPSPSDAPAVQPAAAHPPASQQPAGEPAVAAPLVVPPPVAPPPVAPPVTTAKKKHVVATPAPAPLSPVPSGEGLLTVPERNPWVRVFIDGKDTGPSPLLKHPMPAGRHVVELRDPVTGNTSSTHTIDIVDGETIVVR